jgi:hypothetical protein
VHTRRAREVQHTQRSQWLQWVGGSIGGSARSSASRACCSGVRAPSKLPTCPWMANRCQPTGVQRDPPDLEPISSVARLAVACGRAAAGGGRAPCCQMCARAGRQGILVGVTGRRRGPCAACVRGCNAHGEAGGEACGRSLLSRLFSACCRVYPHPTVRCGHTTSSAWARACGISHTTVCVSSVREVSRASMIQKPQQFLENRARNRSKAPIFFRLRRGSLRRRLRRAQLGAVPGGFTRAQPEKLK